MFSIKYNDLKRTKKQYSHNLKNKYNDSYKLHEKISSTLNHSIQSNISETTASKSNTTKTFSSKYQKQINENNNHYQLKKCSYIDFLELRKTKNSYPIGSQEKRFQWQNLKNENIVIYPEIYKKPHKKQLLLKEAFGEGLLGFLKNRKVFEDKPRIRRLRRCKSEESRNMGFHIQNTDLDISRRVIDPLYNKEPERICKKKSFSQSKCLYHRTDGGLKSLFDLTPIDIPIKWKKLFRAKSYGGMNLFDDEYGRYEMPTHTKKQFIDNKCYYDHIKDENLIFEMDNSWKIKRSKTVVNPPPRFKTDIEFFLKRNIRNLKLRDYDKNNNNMNKTTIGRNLSKIKRIIKKSKK